jgi:putative oxidoreductase
MGAGRLLLRVTIGGYFVGHGLQKLAGWFGGPGLESAGRHFESVGLRPGRRMATAASATEVVGGTLLVLGLATPAAAAGLSGVMVSAIRHVHGPKGPWNAQGGYELNAVLLAALGALVEAGPGRLSLDHALGIEQRGTVIALGALGAGVAGSFAVSELAARRPIEDVELSGTEEPTTREQAAAAEADGYEPKRSIRSRA